MAEQQTVRTRIAPSPTGFAHIGTIYQVLFDYAFAKKHQGKFIVRIEDTDQTRFVEGAEDVIFKSLDWFGLAEDESPRKGGPFAPYRQSERLDLYKKYAEELVEKGHGYFCFCTPERLTAMREEQQKAGKAPMYDKHCLNLTAEEIKANLDSGMKKVIRLKVPTGEKIKFHDEISGDLEFDSNLIDDQVLLKSDGFPTYHLGVVVDDYEMKITHIFRGTEWIPSTPKHILLYQFFGWENQIPIFAHLPLLLNADSPGKLSKRDAAMSVDFYKTEGYLPEAVLNYLSNVVWNHPQGIEIYDLEEFTKLFEIKDLQAKGAKFDLKKLDWMNGEYIRKMDDEELVKRLRDFLIDLSAETLVKAGHPSKERLSELVPLVKERIKKLSDFIPLTAWMFEDIEYDRQFFERTKVDNPSEVLEKVLEKLEGIEKPWDKEVFENTFVNLAKELNLNNTQMFQLIRVAVSGQLISPPLFESLQILGEEKTVERINSALKFLEK